MRYFSAEATAKKQHMATLPCKQHSKTVTRALVAQACTHNTTTNKTVASDGAPNEPQATHNLGGIPRSYQAAAGSLGILVVTGLGPCAAGYRILGIANVAARQRDIK